MFSDSVKYKDMDNFKCTYIFDKDLMRNPESDKYVSFYNATMQAVLVAADCNPKWLTKHIPTLASTRQVPVLCIKDNKGGSVRLGHVVNIRTALAIGVKVSLFSFLIDSNMLYCLASIHETGVQMNVRLETAWSTRLSTRSWIVVSNEP